MQKQAIDHHRHKLLMKFYRPCNFVEVANVSLRR